MIKIARFLGCAAMIFLICITNVQNAPSAQAKEYPNPALFTPGGAPLDPLCFLNNVGTEENPIYPTERCEWEELIADETAESPLDENKYISVSYTIDGNYNQEELDENGQPLDLKFHGFVGYRAVGQVGDYIAVELIENGGGSGIFSSLMWVEYDEDLENNTARFINRGTIDGGDRCMGGIAEAAVVDEIGLTYGTHTTAGDMLYLVGDPERAILKSDAAQNLPFCSPCCYGVAHYDNNGLTGFTFNEDLPEKIKDKDKQYENEATQCSDSLIAMNMKYGNSYFNAEDFGYFVREIEHTCLGRMEGEE